MKMTNTNFKSQLPFAAPIESASSIVDSRGGWSRAASTPQGSHGRHVEMASGPEFAQFIPRDLEADTALSIEQVVDMQMPVQKHMDESGGTEDAILSGDWRLLAERASTEMDPDKLMIIVDDLNRVLEGSQRKRPSK
jgi:hypothetical protein